MVVTEVTQVTDPIFGCCRYSSYGSYDSYEGYGRVFLATLRVGGSEGVMVKDNKKTDNFFEILPKVCGS